MCLHIRQLIGNSPGKIGIGIGICHIRKQGISKGIPIHDQTALFYRVYGSDPGIKIALDLFHSSIGGLFVIIDLIVCCRCQRIQHSIQVSCIIPAHCIAFSLIGIMVLTKGIHQYICCQCCTLIIPVGIPGMVENLILLHQCLVQVCISNLFCLQPVFQILSVCLVRYLQLIIIRHVISVERVFIGSNGKQEIHSLFLQSLLGHGQHMGNIEQASVRQ